MTGIVIEWQNTFGFLRGDDGVSMFVHRRECPRKFLPVGTRVEFVVGEHDGRLCAKNVSIIEPEPTLSVPAATSSAPASFESFWPRKAGSAAHYKGLHADER